MSKQRARDRAAREAAAAEAVRAARPAPSRPSPGAKPASGARPGARRPAEPVYRLRRFPPLPWRLKAALALGWLAVVVLVLVLVPSWTGRLGLVLLTTAALPLVVVLVRDPSRRTR